MILILILRVCTSRNITCNGSDKKICNILCTEPNSCSDAIIYCKNEECNVICNNTMSCYNSSIIIPHPMLQVNVSCSNGDNACNLLSIQSLSSQQTKANIHVYCQANNTCNKMEIYGLDNDIIELYCNYNGSCSNVRINATNSNNVYIDCNASYSCLRLSLYAPQWDYIECNGDYACENLVLYTLDGVDNPHSNNYLNCDIKSSTVCANATAYCNPGFQSNCVFQYEFNSTSESGEWSCEGLCGN